MKRVFKTTIEQLKEFPFIGGKKVLAIMATICISLSLNASTINWITFINTDDPNVGSIGKNSKGILYERLINIVNSELNLYGYNHKIYDYYSGNFSSQDCQNAIKNLNCDTTDIIVFYYIGHGLRLSNDIERVKYPTILFDTDLNSGIPVSWIHQTLKEKKARLTLTIAVSSNTYIESSEKTGVCEVLLPSIKNIKVLHATVSQFKSAVSKAFLGSKGDIIICSASPYQESWATQTPYGSMDVFTYILVSSFESKKFEKDFSWLSFLNEVSEFTQEATKEMPLHGAQVPVFDYDLIVFQNN